MVENTPSPWSDSLSTKRDSFYCERFIQSWIVRKIKLYYAKYGRTQY